MNWVWNTKDRLIGKRACLAWKHHRKLGAVVHLEAGRSGVQGHPQLKKKKWSLRPAWFNMKSWVQRRKNIYIWIYMSIHTHMYTYTHIYLFRHCWFKWTLLNTATSNYTITAPLKYFPNKSHSIYQLVLQCLIIYMPWH